MRVGSAPSLFSCVILHRVLAAIGIHAGHAFGLVFGLVVGVVCSSSARAEIVWLGENLPSGKSFWVGARASVASTTEDIQAVASCEGASCPYAGEWWGRYRKIPLSRSGLQESVTARARWSHPQYGSMQAVTRANQATTLGADSMSTRGELDIQYSKQGNVQALHRGIGISHASVHFRVVGEDHRFRATGGLFLSRAQSANAQVFIEMASVPNMGGGGVNAYWGRNSREQGRVVPVEESGVLKPGVYWIRWWVSIDAFANASGYFDFRMAFEPVTPAASIATGPGAGGNAGGKNLGVEGCPILAGNPINVATGNKLHVETDYTGAAVTRLAYRRFYNSLANTRGPVGANWSATYQRSVRVTGNTAQVGRDDGRIETFTRIAAGWQPDPDVTNRLSEVQGGWQVITADDTVERYDPQGRLVAIRTRGEAPTTLVYDPSGRLIGVTGPNGHKLQLAYDAAGRIGQMAGPDGAVTTYGYDARNNLVQVAYPDRSIRRYLYESAAFPNALTGIVDENGSRFATYRYDARGRAIASEHAGGAQRVAITYNADGRSGVADALGGSRTYTFVNQHGASRPQQASGAGCSGCGAQAWGYDANGFVSRVMDLRGTVTRFIRDARGLETERTEAADTPVARTTRTRWHSSLRLPLAITQDGRTLQFTYDADGRLVKRTLQAGQQLREWSYRHDARGRLVWIDGPRTDVEDVVRLAYHADGTLASVTNALGHVTSYTHYDAAGRLLRMVDPNGVFTDLAYDARGRLVSQGTAGRLTRYRYDAAGQLTGIARADGAVMTYVWDAAHRLIGISDALGNRIMYTLDAMGNRVREQVADATGAPTVVRSRVFDNQGRLAQQIGAQNQVTRLERDGNGNVTAIADPLGAVTRLVFDEHDRPIALTDALGATTRAQYDPQGNLLGVMDARGVITRHGHDALGDRTSTQSPDGGALSLRLDDSGQPVAMRDEEDRSAMLQNDALGRPVVLRHAGVEPVSFEYDAGPGATGRLTRMTDGSGSTVWSYDTYGRIVRMTQTVENVPLSLAYGYDAAGRLISMTYPSGRTLRLAYQADRISAVAVDGTAIVSGIRYRPFGSAASWTWGSGRPYQRVFDTDGRLTQYPLGDRTRQLAFDAAGRITGYRDTDARRNASFAYDPTGRLTRFAASGDMPAETYAYDALGNRIAQDIQGRGRTTFGYPPGSNHLATISGPDGTRALRYDRTGNLIDDGRNRFEYDARNRLVRASNDQGSTRYLLNGNGQRVAKIGESAGMLFVHDAAGRLIGEYTRDGRVIRELVHLEGTPIASLEARELLYVFADHLGAPRVLTQIDGTVVWDWDGSPFGSTPPRVTRSAGPDGSAFNFNFRFPGQYFDAETGLHHNGFRDYDPGTGRYVQSDPVGLAGGLNRFAYTGSNPLSSIDPFGLWSTEAHDYFIDQMFPDLDPRMRDRIKAGSREADSVEYQGNDSVFMHAMSSSTLSPEASRKKMCDFIAGELASARSSIGEGRFEEGYFKLGMALHPVMDSTSPAHSGYQPWNGVVDSIVEEYGFQHGSEFGSIEGLGAVKPYRETTIRAMSQAVAGDFSECRCTATPGQQTPSASGPSGRTVPPVSGNWTFGSAMRAGR